jgi:hypothetical protein
MAWTNCLNISKDDNEREGVLIHLARIKIAAGRLAEAQAQLDMITNPAFADMRQRLVRNLSEKREQAIHPPGAATNHLDTAAAGLADTNSSLRAGQNQATSVLVTTNLPVAAPAGQTNP